MAPTVPHADLKIASSSGRSKAAGRTDIPRRTSSSRKRLVVRCWAWEPHNWVVTMTSRAPMRKGIPFLKGAFYSRIRVSKDILRKVRPTFNPPRSRGAKS